VFEECEDHTLPRISLAQMKQFETRNHIAFPAPLRSALLKLNGGAFQWNIFKRGEVLYVIHGFCGVDPKGEASSRLTVLADAASGLSRAFTKKTGHPQKIFLFDNEFPLDWHWALNFNASPTDPSIWIIEPDEVASSFQVFKNWRELESCRYEGDENPSVDFNKWPDGEILLDDHVKGSLRQRLVLRGGVACLQREYECADDISRSEYCFKLSTLDRRSPSMQHQRNETPEISVGFRAPAVSTAECTLLGGRWMNGRRFLNVVEPPGGASLTFHSLDKALQIFRFLAGA
jgi:hypothetical protein